MLLRYFDIHSPCIRVAIDACLRHRGIGNVMRDRHIGDGILRAWKICLPDPFAKL